MVSFFGRWDVKKTSMLRGKINGRRNTKDENFWRGQIYIYGFQNWEASYPCTFWTFLRISCSHSNTMLYSAQPHLLSSIKLNDPQVGYSLVLQIATLKYIWLERIAAIIWFPFASLLNSHMKDWKRKKYRESWGWRSSGLIWKLRIDLTSFYIFNQINKLN